ncbi:GNAT family N-acetyltransferase [Frigidibacter sp.]|uniref:GNAT family N-acetyltransferase n=1 Tax=Frigidibacter sp. TaxID=2586418 RepID=UPI002735E70E|nr:GNAT family N-acetyltransferase [Frigidibacter sp.]MDP3338961.1 GNAT family N-acetyltransferase [Frigidibacter sp.]
MTAPTLHTARLTLRPIVAADFPAYAALMGSSRAAGMGGPFDTFRAWGVFCHDVACWALYGHGGLMIERNDTGATIGQVGLNAGPLFPEPELGWLLYDGSEGQGFATEAAARLRDWAFETLPLGSLVSYTDPDNHASIAVARRLGALLDPEAPRQDPEDLVWRHPRMAA